MELLKLKNVINKMNYSEDPNSSYNYISKDSMLSNLGFDNIGDFKKYNPIFLRKNKLDNDKIGYGILLN